MMKTATFLLLSTFIVFWARKSHNLNPSLEESLISCLKLRQQAPSLNLNCEDLIAKSEKARMPVLDINQTVTSSLPYEQEVGSELERIANLENLMDTMANNILIMNREVQTLKKSLNRTRNGKTPPLKLKNNQNKTKHSVLPMKTFDSLELDSQLLNSRKNVDANDDIAERKARHHLEEHKFIDHSGQKLLVKEIPLQDIQNNVKKISKSDEEKLFDLISKLKQN